MTKFRTSVIMKTDMVESTPKIIGLSPSEFTHLLAQQQNLISDVVLAREGSIIRAEGDSFWIVFPSVTTAVLAAVDMQQNLKAMQAGQGEGRLAIRIVIAVGDVIHDADDLHGSTMGLISRIEKITPGDEIYLSQAAWLILPKAEVRTAYVNEYKLKGFDEIEKIYKVEQTHKTRIVKDQYIVIADVAGFTLFTRSNTPDEIEKFLVTYDNLMNDLTAQNAGIVRNTSGDLYFLTFADLQATLMAMDSLHEAWKTIAKSFGLGLRVGINKGDLYILRSYVFGEDINAANLIAGFGDGADVMGHCYVIATTKIYAESRGTTWEQRFRELDPAQIISQFERRNAGQYGAYRFLPNG